MEYIHSTSISRSQSRQNDHQIQCRPNDCRRNDWTATAAGTNTSLTVRWYVIAGVVVNRTLIRFASTIRGRVVDVLPHLRVHSRSWGTICSATCIDVAGGISGTSYTVTGLSPGLQ